MPKATWNGAVLAESSETIEIEGNQYFPPESVKRQYLEDSTMHSTCPWKGEASYYHVVVNSEKNPDAGITPVPKMLQPRSKTTLRSGKVFRFPERTFT